MPAMGQDDPSVSERPLPEAMRELMAAAGLSFRALAAETRRHDEAGKGLTHGHLGQLAGGHQHPSQRALELLAATFGVDPEFFVEYRLARLRHELNKREVGYERALRTPHRFDDSRLVA